MLTKAPRVPAPAGKRPADQEQTHLVRCITKQNGTSCRARPLTGVSKFTCDKCIHWRQAADERWEGDCAVGVGLSGG